MQLCYKNLHIRKLPTVEGLLALSFLLSFLLSFAQAQPVDYQKDIDLAYRKIFSTPLGRSICKHILGADPETIEVHLGISTSTAKQISGSCSRAEKSPFIFATDPRDIQKLTLKSYYSRRKYKFLQSDRSFPIESWTEPFTNTTYIVAEHPLPQEKLVQLLAHEMAVYFDSKANPAHPDADRIPALRGLDLKFEGTMNPLVAVSNPLVAHTLTYVRALQVEMGIVTSLLGTRQIKPPDDYDDRYLSYIGSRKCTKTCLQSLLLRMRNTYSPISLPLLAFAPHFRSIMLNELQRIQPAWTGHQWSAAQRILNQLPVDFLKTQFSGAPLEDIKKVFSSNPENQDGFVESADFLNSVLWPIELEAISTATTKSGQSFLEFLKTPLLSGYNISLSSGPRVRIRTGGIE